MKVLLTGATGFVGRHIREALAERWTIVAPRHQELDVTDDAAVDRVLRDGRFDAVVHAAVQGGANVLDSTLRGYWNFARNASRVGRIVYFGSGAEFAKHRDLVKVREDAIGDVTPRDPYGLAKLICTTLARGSDNIVNLRLFGVFGPYEGYKAKFISNAVAKTLAGVPLVIRQNVVFDYLWIDDLVRMLPTFVEGERRFADVNATPAESVKLTDIAALVLREGNSRSEIEIETPGLNFQYTGDNGRLLESCPGFAFTPVRDGVRKLFEYYRSHMELIDREALEADEYRRRCTARTAEGMETRK